MSPFNTGGRLLLYGDLFFNSFCNFWYCFSSGGEITHQHLLHGVPAPNLTRAQSSLFILDLSIISPILLSILPLLAIRHPVYASCKLECSNIASRIAAVHCIREW